MVWGCIGWDGVGFLTKLDVNMTKELYLEVQKDELMDTLEYYGKEVGDVIFQLDNAPSHKAGLTRNWLSYHGFEVLKWPSYSPDLNPIENLWTHLKRELRTYDQPPRGMVGLWDRVQEKWEQIEPQVCQDLIESMPRRMAAVIKAKRGVTK
jgi:transposase